MKFVCRFLTSTRILGAASALAITFAAPASAEEEKTRNFSIEAQPLAKALVEFSRQSDITVIVPSKTTRGLQSRAVVGEMEPADALEALLGETDLDLRTGRDGAIILAQVSEESAPIGETRVEDDTGSFAVSEDEEDEFQQLEEIVVTGSNIRGTGFGASPAFVLDRSYIESTGFSTIEQLIDSIPQNFGGGASLDTVASPDRQTGLNRAAGSSVNLRGLGVGSTLVLLNGRRLAPSGEGAAFVDISLIPLSAIERVEVLTDGASAIYGSDAIGGVVNFITRKSFDGAETSLRYGTVTEGNLDEHKVSQTFGKSWSSGHGFIAYEYFNRDNLGADERDFSSSTEDADLLPGEGRHSFLVSVSQNVTDRVNLFADALYSNRDSDIRENFGLPRVRTANTEQFNVSTGAEVETTADWTIDLIGNYSRNDLGFDITGGSPTSGVSDSELVSVDVKVDGRLFDLPGGPVKLAIGGSYRNESFRFENTFIDRVDVNLDRDVYGAFGELFIPLVSEKNRFPGAEQLELTVAGRFEDYSDFGSTARPKVGVVWSPLGGVSLRSTYSSSFKAPNLADLSDADNGLLLFVSPDPASATGSTLTLDRFGNNAQLGPEEARAWTAGVDFEPEAIPGLSVKLTYFDIEFDDRVDAAFSLVFDALLNPDVFASVITRDPSPTEVAALVAEAEARGAFINLGNNNLGPLIPFDPADVGAIIDQRLRNISSTRVNGIEFALSYGFETDIGDFNFGLRGDYLFEYEEAITPTAPSADIVDTVFNPADFRMRGNASWSHNGIDITTFVNYVDDYTDTLVSPEQPVESYTTVDIQFSYRTEQVFNSPWLNNIRFLITASNVFDKTPPFVQPSFFLPFSFDPTNSSPLGRFIAFQIEKAW